MDVEYWSTKPYSYDQVHIILDEIDTYSLHLSEAELRVLARFQKEFRREIPTEGVTFPWDRTNLRKLAHPSDYEVPAFFMTYNMSGASGWISWLETFRVQNNGAATRGYNTDFLEISGSMGRLDLTTQFTFHRVTRNDEFTELPDTYREGYLLDRDYVKWINWDYPTSSLTYSHPDFTIGIHRQPVYWGYSSSNSPILSNNVNPLPYVEWNTQLPHIRFKFMHARLSPNNAPRPDTTNIRRNLSAHRVEFDLGPRLEFAFNEMVVYAYRDFELGYLNPMSFLFAEEHAQGDLDNKLMALDFKWRLFPGLTSYGTWFFDELDFWKLFSGWWGNKFVFQIGATYYPSVNLPSVNIEYTAARPWTYTHTDRVNSFSSAGRHLGLIAGPNTSNLKLSSIWQMNHNLQLTGEVRYLTAGDGPGTDIFDDPSVMVEEETDFLTGNLSSSTSAMLGLNYYANRVFSVNLLWYLDEYFQAGVTFSW